MSRTHLRLPARKRSTASVTGIESTSLMSTGTIGTRPPGFRELGEYAAGRGVSKSLEMYAGELLPGLWPGTGAYASASAPLTRGFIYYREAVGMAIESGFEGPMCREHGGVGRRVAAMNRNYILGILEAKLPDH